MVFNTHLDHQSQEAREKSVRLIASRIAQRKPGDRFILMGDFNADETNSVVTYLTGQTEESSPVPMIDTFRALHPEAQNTGTGNRFAGATDGPRVDYIFAPADSKILEAGIIHTHREGFYPSDHYPVHATLRWEP